MIERLRQADLVARGSRSPLPGASPLRPHPPPLGLTLLILLALAALDCACTVDDESVENKPCTPVGADPNKDCVKGYACLCQQGQCLCRKVQSLLPPPTSIVAPDPARPEDPNVLFLRRLGLFRE